MVAIVDDNELMRGALQGLLEKAGFRARAFTSPREFLNSGQQHRASCLITDIRMPGISGLDLQTRLHAEQIKIPIIFMSAHVDEYTRMQASRWGAVWFLAKPFDSEVLLDTVRAALEALNP